MYENRTVKPVENILRRQRGIKWRDRGVNLIETYFMHM
jgi:hypothetical protein